MDKKECFKCKSIKPITYFYKHPQMADGHVNKCKECNKRDVRINYKQNKDKYFKYNKQRFHFDEKTIMISKYSGLKRRSSHPDKSRYSVTGKKYLTWSSFKKWWSQNRKQFVKLHTEWINTNFERRLAPSIDRIDNNKGYMPKNMQWLTLSENNKKFTK